MLQRLDVALDCTDVDTQADFWAAALGYDRFGSGAQYRSLVAPPGAPGPKVILQQVPEPRTVKNRMHLDLIVDDVATEVARLEALGARRLDPGPVSELGITWVVMADPEGNEFCVCDS